MRPAPTTDGERNQPGGGDAVDTHADDHGAARPESQAGVDGDGRMTGDGAPSADSEGPSPRGRPSRRRIAIRRGVVLALLLIAILISTAFDREDGGGPLNSFKDVVTSLTGKVQDVAVGAARPFRDGWNWFGDISSVRGERDRLRDEVERLRGELAGRQVDNERLDELEELLSLQSETPEGYSPTAANILTRPLVDVAREARIDKGTNQGVTVNSLVFAPTGDDVPSQYFGALIGRVTRVNADTADVVFLTSNTTSIAAKTLLGINLGLLKANSLGELRVEGIPTSAAISENMIVVTQGVGTDNLLSPYPQGIPIGYISSFGGAESGGDWTVQVTPFADPNTLRTVMIYIPRTAIAKRRAGLR